MEAGNPMFVTQADLERTLRFQARGTGMLLAHAALFLAPSQKEQFFCAMCELEGFLDTRDFECGLRMFIETAIDEFEAHLFAPPKDSVITDL